jgi:4-hydroxybenzoyl-CoA reductase subunit beta
MLPLPIFQLHRPRSVDEALTMLERHAPSARIVAGGTDLFPNMKQGLQTPRHLVSLAGVAELSHVTREPDRLVLGAMASLEAVATNDEVRQHAAALAEAAGAVGAPTHRRMGTLGGNLCLDTRCRYYNQTYFWRSALGFCIKKDGTVCHVVAGGTKCVAAASNDTAAPAIALGGTVAVMGPRGARHVPAAELWTADGAANTTLAEGEIVLGLQVPIVAGRRSAYEKLRRRGAIDFPLLSVAARADVADGRVTDLELVVSALAARPRRVTSVRELSIGQRLDAVPIDAIAKAAQAECKPMPNVDADTTWRKQMVLVLVRRALARMIHGDHYPSSGSAYR